MQLSAYLSSRFDIEEYPYGIHAFDHRDEYIKI